MEMMVYFSCAGQSGHPWFCLIQAMLMLLGDQSRSTVPLCRFGVLASPRLVLVFWVVLLVLQPQLLSLLNEGTLLCFREKTEEEKGRIIEGSFLNTSKYIYRTMFAPKCVQY